MADRAMVQDKGKLLVVDDEPDVLDFVERVFRREYRVLRAESVDQALPLLEGEPLDLVIADHRMPRRRGDELLIEARTRQPSALRVLLTGYDDRDDCPEYAHLRLVKPIDGEDLKQQILGALRSLPPRSP